MNVTAYDIAKRYIGTEELSGGRDHPLIQWWLSLCGLGLHSPDEVAWCSAFVQHAPFELDLPRSKNAAARSWLRIGRPVALEEAVPGFDVVVLKRGSGQQPGPEVIEGAPGHVGWLAGIVGLDVAVLGGNQSDSVNVLRFPRSRILGIRRLV